MSQKKINVKEKLNNDGEIDLSMLEIQDVPIKEIAALKKATTLNLYNNSIQKLPKNFSTLTHLVKLDLSKNSLRELPENFGDLIKLRHLDLYQNQLSALPLSFSKLKALKWLDLKENPLGTTLAKVAGPCENTKQCQTCARNIVSYMMRQQNRFNAEQEEKAKQKKIQLQNEQHKKEEKKAKKNENKSENNGNVQVMTKTEKKRLKKLKKQSEIKSSKGSFLLIFIVLLFTLFVLTSLNYLKFIEDKFVEVYFILIGMLPSDYKVYGDLVAQNVKAAHLKTGQFVLGLIEFVQTNEQLKVFIESCKKIANDLWLKICTYYQNIIS